MIKVKTTADTYKSVVLQRAILICWALLFVCFAVKIFGGNYFAIMVSSPRFVEFCEFIDNNIVLYGLLGLISSLISYALFYLALLKQLWFTKKQFIIFTTTVFVFCILRILFDKQGFFGWAITLINIIQCFAIPFVLGIKLNQKGILYCLIGNILNFAFQVIAAITKNIGVRLSTDSSLSTMIFMIDLYIMLVLYYLYSNRKEKD